MKQIFNKSVCILISLICFGLLQSYSQAEASSSVEEQMEMKDNVPESVKIKAKNLLAEIKMHEKIVHSSNRSDFKERRLNEIKKGISEYNALAQQYGFEPYDSSLSGGSAKQKRNATSGESGFQSSKTTSSSNEAIVLTVSSDGPTKDDAVKNALRLAIEQAYGAFVSANTTILNDELVKDEIVTVTHGAVKEFKEIAGAQLPDNRYSVTIQATVSLPNLITYAKNHGSECEFAGKTFAMELKLFELEKENERKALYNLIPIIEQICKNTMHWELEISEPYIPRITKDLDRDKDRFEFKDYWLDRSPGTGYVKLDKVKYSNIYDFFNKVIEKPTDFCGIDIKIWWLPKGERIEFAEIAKDYLREMSMDRESYYALNEKGYDIGQLMDRDSNFEETDIYKPYVYYSRLDQKTLSEWYQILMDKIHDIKYSFVIIDANGNISNFHPDELIRLESSREKIVDKGDYQMWTCDKYNDHYGYVLFGGSGLFNPLTVAKTIELDPFYNPFTEYVDVAGQSGGDEIYWDRSYNNPRNLEKGYPGWNMSVIVPMKEAQNFTSFKIQSKD